MVSNIYPRCPSLVVESWMLGRHVTILNNFPVFLVPRCAHVVSSERWDMCNLWEVACKREGISSSPLYSFLLAGMRKGPLELVQPLWNI